MANYFSLRRAASTVWQSWRGLRDAPTLTSSGCAGDELKSRMEAAAQLLRAPYEDYATSVSTREMAVSWPTACYLYALAGHRKPQRIVDLGSGFSSFVLRSYAAQASHPCQVTSVDDDVNWLGRTANYLRQRGLSTDRLIAWNEFFDHIPAEKFDLVFHDMGSMELRATSLPQVLTTVSESGIVVLDDMHKPRYRKSAHESVDQFGWTALSARATTLDSLGRFSEVALRRCA